MKIENKDFWEKDTIIATQFLKKTSDFEDFMLHNAQKRNPSIKNIKIFGCGTGREVESIAEFFKPSSIVASDISENMILKCKENLKLWKIDTITKTIVGNAKDLKENKSFDLVTILNSMLTYVPKQEDRLMIFQNSYNALTSNGVIIGTVHNQVGVLSKTIYFMIRNFFSFILGTKVGNRNTGFNGFSVSGYYYDKKTLHNDLKKSGFVSIEILSLEEYYKTVNVIYNRKKGYNNLIFVASKN